LEQSVTFSFALLKNGRYDLLAVYCALSKAMPRTISRQGMGIMKTQIAFSLVISINFTDINGNKRTRWANAYGAACKARM
jgi:hypothetical protein